MEWNSPMYAHDCDECVFLGTVGDLDVYSHKNESTPKNPDGWITFVVRYSSFSCENFTTDDDYFVRKIFSSNESGYGSPYNMAIIAALLRHCDTFPTDRKELKGCIWKVHGRLQKRQN